MLSRPNLNIELENALKAFDSTWERTPLATSQLLVTLTERLIVLTSAVPADRSEETVKDIANKTAEQIEEETILIKKDSLRKRLREILDAEETFLLDKEFREILDAEGKFLRTKEFCDQIFNLQITLAKVFPLNDRDANGAWLDPIELVAMDPNDGYVFFSDGQVISRTWAKTYFDKPVSRDNDDQYVDLNRTVMSERELTSLRAQGMNVGRALSPLAKEGRNIGKRVGTVLGLGIAFFLGFAFPPSLILSAVVAGGIASMMLQPCSLGFALGLCAAIVVGSSAVVLFPPLLSVLVATSVMTSSAAAAAATTWLTTILPIALPSIIVTATILTSAVSSLSISESLVALTLLPVIIMRGICSSIGEILGTVAGVFAKLFNLTPRRPVVAPQQNPDSDAANAPIGRPIEPALQRNQSSSSHVISILGANTDLTSESERRGLDAVVVQISGRSVVPNQPQPQRVEIDVEPEEQIATPPGGLRA